ncbi:MAG: TonB-dependent receptor [Parvularculaceae bacterium]|nr:TonB-dependent receptor [Parvularculaceae bacterium]
MRKNRLNSALLLGGSVVAASTFLTSHAVAQDDDSGLDIIVVEATRRAESLQDVGLSVSAFDEDGLAKSGVQDVSRLELIVPGVNFAFAGNDAKFNVRGANSTNTFGDNSSIVGAFVDGVYKNRASQQSRAFFDVSRVEFLKGPQGTLYGRNTFAGALNLYTNAPVIGEYSGGVNYSYERFDRSRFEGFVNLPVSDTLAFRVAGFSDKSSGYIENLAGPDIGAQDDKGIRVSALYEPTDRASFVARFSHIQEDGREAGLFGYTFLCRNETPDGLTDAFGSVRNCDNPVRGSGGTPNADELGPYTVAQDYVPPVVLREDVFSLEGNFDLGSVALKSITSITDFENGIGFDFDFSPNPNSNGAYDETLEAFTQEFQLASQGDGPLQWTAGVFYSDEELFQSFSIYQETVRDDSTRGSVTIPQGTFTILEGTDIVSRDRSFGGFFADSQIISTTAFGLYGQAEYSLSEQLRLIGGIRYNYEDKELTGGGSNFTGDTNGDGTVDRVVNVAPGAAGFSPATLPPSSIDVFTFNFGASDAITVGQDYDNVTWRAGLEYDASDDVMLYLTASTGFLSGALSTGAGATDEQTSRVIEGGFKSTLLDNTLRLNGALHYTTYDNLLTQRQRQDGPIVVTESINGGEIEAWGLELDAVWVPVDNLTITGNLAWLDSEFAEFGQTNPYQLFRGEVQGFIDVSGETTGWSPDLTVGASAAYEMDLGDKGVLTPLIQFYYSDEYNTSNLLAIDPSQQQDAFTKTDLRLIWDTPIEDFSMELFVENLEDEAVLTRGNNNGDDIVQTSFQYPRNYGFRARLRF